MKFRNISIFVLLLAGLLLFGLVEGVWVPHSERREQELNQAQLNPLTHDITHSEKFATKYMGDASKVGGLFRSLPAKPISSFALDPDTFTVQLNIKNTEPEQEQEDGQVLLYSATAAFALIDNLQAVIFNYGSAAYKVTRDDMQKWYGVDTLASLTENTDVWEKEVQSKLADREYVTQALHSLFRKTEALSV